jgi:hypothetical protein
MAKRKYSIGVDFGAESGRAVLVDVSNGGEIGEAKLVHPLVLGHEFAGVTEDCQRVAIDSAIPAGPVNLVNTVSPMYVRTWSLQNATYKMAHWRILRIDGMRWELLLP